MSFVTGTRPFDSPPKTIPQVLGEHDSRKRAKDGERDFYHRTPKQVEDAQALDARRFPEPPEIKPVPFWKEEQELTLRLIQSQASDTTKFKPVPLPFIGEAAE